MEKKIGYFLVAFLLALTGILPANAAGLFAAEQKLIVDDNITSGTNYFTYFGGSDFSGMKGWSDDPAHKLPAGSSPELVSQHWVWNNDGTASNYTYSFTFVGTGVELVGIPNDNKNIFQLDKEVLETKEISGSGETILYSRTDLSYGEHTVYVSLPTGKNYTGLQISYANVYGTKDVPVQSMSTKILPSQIDGPINYFSYTAYSGKTWSYGDSEAYIDLGKSDANAEACYYEIPFIGNAIDLYAMKSYNHGIVKYSVDGQYEKTVDLYNASRTQPQSVYKLENLSEGEHMLKAVTMPSKNASSSSVVNQVAYAMVKHAPYAVKDIILDNTSYVLAEGATQPIRYTFDPSYASTDDITFESEDETIASVSAKGVILANKVGSTTITLASETYGIQKTVAIEVKPSIPGITGSIVDTQTQYTQDRYDEIINLGLISKRVTAWKNDKAVSEISLASKDSALKNVIITTSDLVNGDQKIASDQIEATFIKSTQAYNGSYLGYGSKTRPVPAVTDTNRSESNDILYQTTPIDIPFNAVQNVWVEFNIPKDAQPGIYTTTISVKADGIDTPLEFTYEVNVQDAVLADTSEFKNGFDVELWQYPYSSAEYYGVEAFSEEHMKIMESSMNIYKEVSGHAITATIVEEAWTGQTYSANEVHYPSMVKWTKDKDGNFLYDYTDFDKWIQLNKDLGIGDKIVLYSIAPWHNSFTYWENDKLVYEAFTAGSARYKTVWKDFLQDLTDHLMEKGWFDESYIGIDERGFSATAFDMIEDVKNIHGESLKSAGAMDNLVAHHDLAMRVTDLNIGDTSATANPALFAQLVNDRDAAGLRTTLYSCTEHEPGNFSLSSPVESYWMIANDGKIDGDGYLRWAYDAWVEDPLRDTTHNAFEPGDCFLIYPDEKDAENPTSKSSVRLEKIFEGVRDVNKLKQMAVDIPSLKPEIDAVYANISGTVATSRSYLSDQRIQELITQVDAFKTDLAKLTDRYIALKNDGTDVVESISIKEGTTSELSIGSSTQLHAILTPSNLLNTNVTWSSNNENVTVNATGVITANKLGSATITVTSQQDPTKSASIMVTVTNITIEDSAKVAYYNFDNNNVMDAWGSRNGTLHGASFFHGKSGSALSMTNAGEYATLDGVSKLGDTWTVSYWVYNTSTAQDRISTLMSTDGNYSFDLRLASNRPNAGVHVGKGAGDVLTFNYKAVVNEWAHLTWTQDKVKGLSLYVNGNLIQTNNWTVKNAFPCPIDQIGAAAFTGQIDDLKVFNRVLNQSEIASTMMVPGLNINTLNKALYIGETHQIETNLISDEEDKTITYTSADPSIAMVTKDGLVTALRRGTTEIIVENKASGYRESVIIQVNKKLFIANTLHQYQLPNENLRDIDKDQGGPRQYLGQPDMVMLNDNKTLITAYPIGHGKGPLVLKMSYDAGETWVEKTNTPSSWAGSQETPTLYKLNLEDGTERVMLITACPGWGTDSYGNQTGWNTSYSDDGGETWTEYKHWYSNLSNGTANKSIVGMASLIQLKDEDGNDIQKWMGVYHNYDYVNFKTYLTFDENGNEQWSEPEPYLSEYRSIESTYQMCEIGMFRSPDGSRMVGLARSQSHNNLATLIYSDDEGETWSKPMDLPGSLAGERHKAVYDPISGRLVITYREIIYDLNGNNKFDGNSDWLAGDWVAWVGTYEDLMNQDEGQYRIVIAQDWANNAKSGDTGYAGIVVQPDGTFIMDSYGHWDKDFSLSWTGGVTTDLCYIKQAKFKLGQIDNMAGLIDRTNIKLAIANAENVKNEGYSEESWKNFMDALAHAKAVEADPSSAQQLMDEAVFTLAKAQAALSSAEMSSAKMILNDAIDKAEMIISKGGLETLAPNVASMIRVRLAEAKATLDNINATDEMYLEAWLSLANAMHYLEFKADKTDLQALVEICNEINTDEYSSGVEAFLAALNHANEVLKDDGVLQDTINRAWHDLDQAKKALIRNISDKETLKTIITIMKEAVADGSTYRHDRYWDAYVEALANAEAILNNDDASTEEVRNALLQLTSAYENIRLLPDEALLTTLKTFVEQVNQLDSHMYSAETFARILDVRDQANAMLEDLNQFEETTYNELLVNIEEMHNLIKTGQITDDEQLNQSTDVPTDTPKEPVDSKITSSIQDTKATTKPATGDVTNVFGMGLLLIMSAGVLKIRKKEEDI